MATRKSNVKPNHHKSGGRGRQGEDTPQTRHKNTAAKKRHVVKKASTNTQGSDKRGKRSTAQKRASSRHDFGPIPATSPVAGAFGKEPSPRRRTPRQG